MNGVYLAGRGLHCALGHDLPSALSALREGGGSPTLVEVAPGFRWPVHAMAPEAGTWLERLTRTVRRVVAQCDVVGTPDMPLFVASSSLDVGFQEDSQCFTGDLQTFADIVARALEWPGPVITVSTACTSAVNAVLAASDLMAAGEVSEALVLGIEFSNGITVAGFGGMQLLSSGNARPFGVVRDGLVLGEAVAALHLRSAPARWLIAGGANIVDGRNPGGAEPRSVVAACRLALQRCGLEASDIDLVKPQAAGSPGNDAIEVKALKQVFGALPPVVAFKSLIGHTMGAAGAAELVLLTGCLEQGVWPSADYELDPALGVALAAAPPARVRYALLNAIGFGGGHAAMVVQDCAA